MKISEQHPLTSPHVLTYLPVVTCTNWVSQNVKSCFEHARMVVLAQSIHNVISIITLKPITISPFVLVRLTSQCFERGPSIKYVRLNRPNI